MTQNTPPDPLKPLEKVIDRLQNPFSLMTVAILLLLIAMGLFVPQVIPLMGRGFFFTLLILDFLAFLASLFAPVISERLLDGKKPDERLPSADDPRAAYLDAIIADCRRARLSGLDPNASDPRRGGLTLDRLYVALNTQTRVEVEDESEKKKRNRAALGERESHPLTALEALERAPERRMVLLGLPGSGKSTFVRYLTLRLAQALRDPALHLPDLLPGWTSGARMPLIVPLGRLAESLTAETMRGTVELVERYVRAVFDADVALKGFGDTLLVELRQHGGLVCFDGLDEVANLNLRAVVREAVEAFADRYARSGVTCLVTCRTFSYTDAAWQLAAWPVHELAPLEEEQIQSFVHAWYTQLGEIYPDLAAGYERKEEKLRDALHPSDRRRLFEIAPNPLLLTVMTVVHTYRGELPDARALVYEECVRLLSDHWVTLHAAAQEKRSLLEALDVPWIVMERALQSVAYRAHEGARDPSDTAGDGHATLVTEDLLMIELHAAFRDFNKVQTFLEFARDANGLLMYQGAAPLPDAPPDTEARHVYTFPHLTFEEYLAGRYLERLSNLGHTVRTHLDRSDRWREPVMLLGEHLCFRSGDFSRLSDILIHLVPTVAPTAPTIQDWRAVWMAGDLLMLYRRALQDKPECDVRVVDRLAALVTEGALTPRERAAAGRTLAVLGDPRPGVLPGGLSSIRIGTKEHGNVTGSSPCMDELEGTLGLQWCHVPAGPFVMGASKTGTTLQHPETGDELIVPPDPEAYDDEGPVHIQSVSYDYWMSRYPITNAQFKVFVDDEKNGYCAIQWWTPAGLAWRKDRKGPDKWGGAFNLSNHPVVGVAWYEAVAFCRWLTARVTNDKIRMTKLPQFVIRLPSEIEWEKAARGGIFLSPVSHGPATPDLLNISEASPGAIPDSQFQIRNSSPSRHYPWGNDPITPQHANYDETGINSTSAVGAFPRGESPYGLLDMSGNVWEWTLTQWVDNYEKYDKTENNQIEGDFRRVLRGGAFFDYGGYARCASRDHYDPYYVNGDYG
ncbi:MAG: SUMF1/EgtB/PvdO family nonheme iron enzyme, partial [Anaerolineae bacterium]|nr:SUMF1/EgtB/PvdO family nonheme iron enzyme [Anaerolineae bacterium]